VVDITTKKLCKCKLLLKFRSRKSRSLFSLL
jgi:hypothetical protein